MNLFSKYKSQTEAKTLIESWKNNNQKVVFTNGCFDILHFGHLYLLSEASKKGDRLVVGLNSRKSVRKLKGTNRPIMDDQSRIGLLCALQWVDLVVIFEEDTPHQLIKNLQPNAIVKGGDYKESQIVGAEYIRENGGEVFVIPFKDGFSTSDIEIKIKRGDKN